MPQTFLYSDSSGKVTEAFIQVTPSSMRFLGEALGLFEPSTKLYVAYSPTAESLGKRFKGYIENPGNMGLEAAKRHLDVIHRNFAEFMPLINSEGNFTLNEIEMIQAYAADQTQKAILDAFKAYVFDEDMREFLNTFLYLETAIKVGYNDGFIQSIAEQNQNMTMFPAEKYINDWARDRMLGGVDSNGNKVIIQGKVAPENRESNNMSPMFERNSASLAMHSFWEQMGFKAIPGSETELELYEGGDILTSDDTAFLGKDTYDINVNMLGKEKAIKLLRSLTGKDRLVFLRAIPNIHCDLYAFPLDGNGIILGDTKPCKRALKDSKLWKDEYERPLREKGKQLDSLASCLEENGLDVKRFPYFFAEKRYMDKRIPSDHISRSYANAIVNGKCVIVAPFGIPELDEMSAEPFERRGLNVKHVESMGSMHQILDEKEILFTGYGRAGMRCSLSVLSRNKRPVTKPNNPSIIETPDLVKTEMEEITQSIVSELGVGRNDPCPCGSGSKFKKCCGRY